MTTPQAEADYLADHLRQWHGHPYAVFNPKDRPVEDLPVIYGFNNGGSPGWFSACLLAADGTPLGGHICSSEGYMPHDLGCIEGARQDRHEKQFQPHYPDGYRMEFVGYDAVREHAGLMSAIHAHQEKNPITEEENAA